MHACEYVHRVIWHTIVGASRLRYKCSCMFISVCMCVRSVWHFDLLPFGHAGTARGTASKA